MDNKHYTPTSENLIADFDLTSWTGEAGDSIRNKTRGGPGAQRVTIVIATLSHSAGEGCA